MEKKFKKDKLKKASINKKLFVIALICLVLIAMNVLTLFYQKNTHIVLLSEDILAIFMVHLLIILMSIMLMLIGNLIKLFLQKKFFKNIDGKKHEKIKWVVRYLMVAVFIFVILFRILVISFKITGLFFPPIQAV